MTAYKNSEALIDAKRELYHQLRCKPHNKLTETEIDLMYHLAFDADIRNLLSKHLREQDG